jgi:hypothetical protein
MIEDSTEEFLMALSGEGSFGLPSPRGHITVASLAPVATTPWIENALAMQATVIVPSRTVVPLPESNLPNK